MNKLGELCAARKRLLEDLGPVLRRAGPKHPTRAKVNAERAKKRKLIRQQLRDNADQIAALVMAMTNFKRGPKRVQSP